MSQQTRILELVEKGAITPEQAQELFAALEVSKKKQPNFVAPTASIPPTPPIAPIPPLPPLPPMPRVATPRSGRPLSGNAGAFSFEQIVQLGQYGIKPDYVAKLQAVGLDNLEFKDIIRLGQYGVKAEFVAGVQNYFYQSKQGPITAKEVASLAQYGVRLEYLHELSQISYGLGLEPLSVKQIIQLAQYGISPQYVREMLSSGILDLDNLNAQTYKDQIRQRREAEREQRELERETRELMQERREAERELEQKTREITSYHRDVTKAHSVIARVHGKQATIKAQLAQAKGNKERERLEEKLEEFNEELEEAQEALLEAQEELAEALAELEEAKAEFEEEYGAGSQLEHEIRVAVEASFNENAIEEIPQPVRAQIVREHPETDLSQYINENDPPEIQRAALVDCIESLSAQLGVATEEHEKNVIRHMLEQAREKLGTLPS